VLKICDVCSLARFDLVRRRDLAVNGDVLVRLPVPMQYRGAALLQLRNVLIKVDMTLRLDNRLGFWQETRLNVSVAIHKGICTTRHDYSI
jgi:hypothetical protein